MIKYVYNQVLWVCMSVAQLLAAFGIGLKWIVMTTRCLLFGVLNIIYFVPSLVWYITSPQIIRHVAYRSSRKTKLQNCRAQLKRCMQQQHTGMRSSTPYDANRGNGHVHEESPCRNEEPYLGAQDHPPFRTVDELVSMLNPADGSYVDGFPVNSNGVTMSKAHEISNCSTSINDAKTILKSIFLNDQKPLNIEERISSLESDSDDALYTSDDSDGDEEDVKNLHNRATLDIYLPMPLDSLLRYVDYEEKIVRTREQEPACDERNTKDNVQSNIPRLKKFPIVISIAGGAWIIGSQMWNVMLARVLAARGYIVFCPDYRNFPQTTMEGMTLDVSDAIAWVLNNAARYNGDLDNVTMIGHSAGAHLAMMSLISQAHLCAYAATGNREGLPPPSGVTYNVPRYNPRQSIHRFIGLSGLYALFRLVKHLDGRGLPRRVFFQIVSGRAQLWRFSPCAYFDDYLLAHTGETLPLIFFDYFPEEMLFAHGDADMSAPVSETARLVYKMRNAQRKMLMTLYQSDPDRALNGPSPVLIEYVLVPGATHTDFVVEEPLSGGYSHALELLENYNMCPSNQRSNGGSSSGAYIPVSPKASTSTAGYVDHDRSELVLTTGHEENAKSITKLVGRPDTILIPPEFSKKRPMVMRLASFVSPF
ncbi:unnamed protein product [Phytomonas sp. EM1]|nr:unnamed protein product [Phytomonas sp. EM1]|eukprot:CCW65488.1 unnamed protein product [Phytomonas sp. isolate EM1]